MSYINASKVRRFFYYVAKAKQEKEEHQHTQDTVQEQLDCLRKATLKKNKSRREITERIEALEHTIQSILHRPVEKKEIDPRVQEFESRIEDLEKDWGYKVAFAQEHSINFDHSDMTKEEPKIIEAPKEDIAEKKMQMASEIESQLAKLEKMYLQQRKKRSTNPAAVELMRKKIEVAKIKLNKLKREI